MQSLLLGLLSHCPKTILISLLTLNQMTRKKPDFPNNWEAIESAPAEIFKAIEVEEFMDWRVSSWDMPDSVVCMIRSENMDDGTIKEYIYQRESDARKRLTKLKDENNQRITVATHDEIVLMTPMWLDK